ncbi:MAG: DUF433 domain-containing protein [Acidobacteriota bacterium]
MSTEICSLLMRSVDVRQNRPCVAGTRTTVHRIAAWYKMGESPEEIAREYPHLTLAGVYAALAYYHANQAEIEAELTADAAEEEQIESEWLLMRSSQVA